MKKFKTGYYQADTINGVTFYDIMMDNPDVDILLPRNFYSLLDGLDDDEIIYTFMDDSDLEMYKKIEKEYGIH